jgi:hypothetical protein
MFMMNLLPYLMLCYITPLSEASDWCLVCVMAPDMQICRRTWAGAGGNILPLGLALISGGAAKYHHFLKTKERKQSRALKLIASLL